MRPDPLAFDVATARDAIGPSIADAGRNGCRPVISSERLAGESGAGGHDSKEIADRLHALFADAPVLIVVREQRQMLISTYHQHPLQGGTLTPAGFFHEDDRLNLPGFRFNYFAYDRLVAYYQKLFGSDRVLVLPFEQFRSDPSELVRAIAELAGTSPAADLEYETRVRTSQRPFLLAMRRSYNRFSPPNAVFPGGRDLPLVRKAFGAAMRAERLVPTAVQRRLERRLIDLVDECAAGRYEASNRRLAELTGIELSRYGYAL